MWAQKGHTLDLRPYVERELDPATIADWAPAQYRAFFTPDGRQYGLPKFHGALALYYNKDLFDRYDERYPDASWTHEDYLSANATPDPRPQRRRPVLTSGQHDLRHLGPIQMHVNAGAATWLTQMTLMP